MRWGRHLPVRSITVRPAPWRRWTTIALGALGLLGSSMRASAQGNTGVVSGRVTDATNGVPMVGVSVRVGATQIGGQTGDDGRYTIRGVTPAPSSCRSTASATRRRSPPFG